MTTHLLQHQQGVNCPCLRPFQESSTSGHQERVIKKVKSLPRNLDSPSNLLKKSSSCATLNEAFNQSLITRIRGVSRPNCDNAQAKQAGKEGQKYLPKLTKLKNNFQNFKQQFSKCRPVTNQSGDMEAAIRDLQATLQKQKRRNQDLTQQIQKSQCQIFIYRQQIQELSDQIREKDRALREMEGFLKEREQECLAEYQSLLQDHENTLLKYQELCEEVDEKGEIIANLLSRQSSRTFKIEGVLEERVISVPAADKMALLRANSEIASLKKQHEAALNELRREQDGELERMRKKFVRDLNHYKEIIIKCTSKGDGRKRDSLLESTFTENSSNQQILP